MIDRFIHNFFGGIDRICEAIANAMAGPRCQCKKKRNSKRTYKHKKDHDTDISFENEVNNGR